jgi:hypothetical protein
MKLETGKIFTMKLTSGEELIGRIVDINDSTIELSEPVSVAPGPQGMGLVPSLFTSERGKNVVVNRVAVTMWCATDDAIQSKYIEATTGITTPSKKIIMG